MTPEDQWNERIEGRLRQAHEQIHFRQEWAEKLLHELNHCAKPQHPKPQISLLPNVQNTGVHWRIALTLVAAMLVVVGSGIWLVRLDSNSDSLAFELPHSNDATDSEPGVGEPYSKQKSRTTESRLAAMQTVSPSVAQQAAVSVNRRGETIAVKPAADYLAARLSTDDPEFEIYVVLPTVKTDLLTEPH
ncbi:MAG: hypothetical protein KDB22_23915 [Planctomycetales bacterium]|nr:hypothetical protein [Planctomycetales bacterium]